MLQNIILEQLATVKSLLKQQKQEAAETKGLETDTEQAKT